MAFLSANSTSLAVSSAESTKPNRVAQIFPNRFLEQRIVRAAENQRIDAALLETAKIRLDRHFDDRIVGPTFFNQRYQQRASAAVNFDGRIRRLERARISAALDRRFGADDTDASYFWCSWPLA